MIEVFVIASASLFMASCATDSLKPPPEGYAVIDAKPINDHPNQIDGIQLVSINGKPVSASRSPISPGLNNIRTKFRWPQGRFQEVDLRFHATEGTLYLIKYHLYPPYENRKKAAQKIVDSIPSNDVYGAIFGTIFFAPPAAIIGIGEGIGDRIHEQKHRATHMDLMVVAHQSSQGVVRRIRAYPDGRVDEKTWAKWAQMKAQ